MVMLNALRAALALPPVQPDVPLPSPEAAAAALPGVPVQQWRPAFLRLLAQEVRPALPAVLTLLTDLQRTLARPQPERDIVVWLADMTGGQATLSSSWNDVVAQHGTPGGSLMEQRLVQDGRPVGRLQLQADAGWSPLLLLVAEVARLARLQAAAAGAARRRVGERQFEALLVGETAGTPEGGPCVLAALRLGKPVPRAGRARDAYVHQLDTLCAVGEGYLYGRRLACLTTVRGDKALWLWQTQDPEREAAGLHAALLAATDLDVRLGVSGRQDGYGRAAAAYRQALQALDEAASPRSLVTFQRLDPLHALLGSAPLTALAEQVRGQLRLADPDGRLEDTLERYLLHGGSLLELAEQLNLHVNTLRYRLRRVEDVLGGQLSEPAFVARLYLAFQAGQGER
ncbi:PucR family transcriptional regulator [Deinococcus carri]